MNRQAKRMQEKSRSNQIVEDAGTKWVVRSATSGEDHTVVRVAGSKLLCDCDWNKYHPKSPCSHRLTVSTHEAAKQGKTVYYWANEEAARRQHKRVIRISDGLWATVS